MDCIDYHTLSAEVGQQYRGPGALFFFFGRVRVDLNREGHLSIWLQLGVYPIEMDPP